MLSFPDHPEPVVFSGIPRRHPKSSSKDGLLLHPLSSLSKAWGKDLLDMLCSNL